MALASGTMGTPSGLTRDMSVRRWKTCRDEMVARELEAAAVAGRKKDGPTRCEEDVRSKRRGARREAMEGS